MQGRSQEFILTEARGLMQGRLHHRKLGANAPKKFQGGGRFDVEPGGDVSNSRNFVS